MSILSDVDAAEFGTWVIDRMRSDLREQRYEEALLLAASDIHDILSGKIEKVGMLWIFQAYACAETIRHS